MLNQPLIEKLLATRLPGMVEALKAQEQDGAIHELTFLDRLSLLVDQQWNWRENQALVRMSVRGKLKIDIVEDSWHFSEARRRHGRCPRVPARC